MPTIYEEILAWSNDRPDWQRDALRRLASRARLSNSDYEELAKQCLATRGLNEAEAPKPVPLAADHLPQQGQASGQVTLTKLFAVKNVGALLADQTLSFAEKGLTIVYGDNGSGKSSYARILKRLCRARGAHGGLRSNVFVAAAPPSATVEFAVGGEPGAVEWKDDGTAPAPSPLSHVAVFDHVAATAYVADKQDASVRPAGLDLLTGLVTACEAVRVRIQGRLTAAKGAAPGLSGFEATTAAGSFVCGLTAGTTDEAIEQAALFSDADKSRADALSNDIARLNSEDPERVARDLRARQARIDSLRQRIENIQGVLGPGATAGIESLRQASDTKEQAAALASSLSFGGALPGVGGEAWRELWEAARRYSTSTAYPQQSFPVTSEAKCVLCQQPLESAARERITHFEEFVCASAAAEAQAAQAALEAATKRVADLPIAMAEDPVLVRELDEGQLGTAVQEALEGAGALREAVLKALDEGAALPSADVVGQLVERLRTSSADLAKRIQDALSTNDPIKKQQLQHELGELTARGALAQRKVDVVAYVKSLRTIGALERCLSDAATNSITAKNTELTKRAVTELLKTYFEEERRGLGLDRTPVALGSAGSARGVLYHQLSLTGALGDASPTDVLSEGELRVCALASFLAETRVAPSKSAIIFDDPVSSFDHLRRENVARRLGVEAVERQVVVFTHDAVFLLALLQAAKARKAPCRVHHVQTYGASAGHCSEGNPWIGMNVSERIGQLKNDWVKADKLFRTNERTIYNALAKQLYGMLRETWERAIEEVLFGDVIQRLRLSVETSRLKTVDVVPGDFERIERGMTRASAQLVGHDQPAALNTPAPEPQTLDADIKELEAWVSEVRSRRTKKPGQGGTVPPAKAPGA